MKNTNMKILSYHQRGLSLVELLIALALSLAVLVGLASVYVAAKQSFRFQETTGRLQEDAIFALDTISRDLRMAGYAGCPGIDVKVDAGPPALTTYYPGSVLDAGSPGGIDGPNPLAQVTAIQAEPGYAAVLVQPFTPANFIRGFDSVPSSMFGTAPTTGTTDSLFFAGGSQKSVTLASAMTSPSGNVILTGDPFNWANATPNSGVYNFIISSCGASSLFKGKVTGTSIDHSTVMGNSVGTLASSTLYSTDATVTPAEWNFYYVSTRPGASTPSLYRVYFNGNSRQAAEEVVANVETMKLQYGENTANNSDGSPTLVANEWRTTAAAVTDWSRVIAVRIGLMMVSAEDNANPEVTLSTPTLLGASYSIPTGASATRLRKEFSTTVVLRNRVSAR